MKTVFMIMMILLMTMWLLQPVNAASTITYTYDKQHRLTEVSYSASEKTFYTYDAANNLDLEVSITDSKYLKSFLLYLSYLVPDRWEPAWLKRLKA